MTFEWSIKITKVSNGYFIEPIGAEGYMDPIVVEEEELTHEEYNESRVDQVSIREVFYHMMEHFNINNDKHAYEGKGQFIKIEVDNEK